MCSKASLLSKIINYFLTGHLDIVDELLAAEADIHIRNGKALTAVQSAAAGGHFEVVLRLVQSGAAWRSPSENSVLKLLTRKTSYKCAFLRLAPASTCKILCG